MAQMRVKSMRKGKREGGEGGGRGRGRGRKDSNQESQAEERKLLVIEPALHREGKPPSAGRERRGWSCRACGGRPENRLQSVHPPSIQIQSLTFFFCFSSCLGSIWFERLCLSLPIGMELRPWRQVNNEIELDDNLAAPPGYNQSWRVSRHGDNEKQRY